MQPYLPGENQGSDARNRVAVVALPTVGVLCAGKSVGKVVGLAPFISCEFDMYNLEWSNTGVSSPENVESNQKSYGNNDLRVGKERRTECYAA